MLFETYSSICNGLLSRAGCKAAVIIEVIAWAGPSGSTLRQKIYGFESKCDPCSRRARLAVCVVPRRSTGSVRRHPVRHCVLKWGLRRHFKENCFDRKFVALNQIMTHAAGTLLSLATLHQSTGSSEPVWHFVLKRVLHRYLKEN